ncbi:MAG TPA: DUF488 family protein [Gemmatimonadaceae bacterium]|nr:DUF488 family protein [Gemmatimonadaceae bacterium]
MRNDPNDEERETMVVTKRVYDGYEPTDGFRVLVDRLWPRGVSKAKAHIDLWAKEIAPSDELRSWYEHDPAKWPEFRRRYTRELKAPEEAAVLDELARRAKRGRVTLVYGSRAGEISNAAVLERLLNRRVKPASSR